MPTNRLIREKSPYLLQHAHNPVDWYPWGEEAFEKARRENKPIFLSVGYSTCHWCHVMERESFESAEVAEFLNRWFVPVKVDREERPDVDRIYMTFVQATTGGGGWPMSVWLTPDLKPFYGGTYFPPEDTYGRPGFLSVLKRIAELWQRDHERIAESGRRLIDELERHLRSDGAAGVLGDGVFDAAFNQFRRSFDAQLGGFGGAPKFPRPVVHQFLVRYWARTGNREALEMVLLTLRRMAAGGIADQLGGGFHRYSVDDRWFVPHFEKMLYDQAQLAVSYLEAFLITGEKFYADVARDVLEYVLRELTSPDGAFYSAEDADSAIDAARPEEKGEGAFYLWSRAEIDELLGSPVADWFAFVYGVEQAGNVRYDPHGEFAGKNILYQAHTIEEAARHFGTDHEVVQAAMAEARRKLLEARARRPRPHRDDKILTSWNGLMISAFALAAQALGDERYLEAARRAARFILDKLWDPAGGTLLRRYRDGEAAIAGFLDDYAFLIAGLLDLYEACFELEFLKTAGRLAERMIELFEDAAQGGFYATAEGDASLVLRLKDDYDGAEPSGNSVAAVALARLAEMTGRGEFRRSAERAVEAFASRLVSLPVSLPLMLVAADFLRARPRQILLAGAKNDPATLELAREVWRRFLPQRVLLLVDPAAREALAAQLPVAAQVAPIDGKAAAYVCENYACRLPVTEGKQLAELLQ
jgi:uncharacterized protein YyaL (SSP411 family)